jgi:hypothetical protein
MASTHCSGCSSCPPDNTTNLNLNSNPNPHTAAGAPPVLQTTSVPQRPKVRTPRLRWTPPTCTLMDARRHATPPSSPWPKSLVSTRPCAVLFSRYQQGMTRVRLCRPGHVQCADCGRHLHSRMTLVPMPARLKLIALCHQTDAY